MYLLSLCTTLLGFAALAGPASASPTQIDGEMLVVRSADGLTARTFWWGHDPKCGDWGRKNSCSSKGYGWFCNSKCECEHQDPPEGCKERDIQKCDAKGKRYQFDHEKCDCKHVGCPAHEKETCEAKGKAYDYDNSQCHCEYKCHESKKAWCDKKGSRYQFDHANCDCVDKGCPAEHKTACLAKGKAFKYDDHECKCDYYCHDSVKKACDKKGKRYAFVANDCDCKDVGCPAHEKETCQHTGGTYSDHECVCTPPKNNDKCRDKRDECKKFGWGCNENTCECTPPQQEQCKSWLKALICYKLGKKCDSNCRCY